MTKTDQMSVPSAGGGGWGWGRSDTKQDKRVGYRHTVSGRTVRSVKEENEAGEGVRWELGWLECEKITVPAPRDHHLMGFEFNDEFPSGALEGGCLGLTSETLI